jgi:hypothetical protein
MASPSPDPGAASSAHTPRRRTTSRIYPTTFSPRSIFSPRSDASSRPRASLRSSSRTGSGGPTSVARPPCSGRPCGSTAAISRSPVSPRASFKAPWSDWGTPALVTVPLSGLPIRFQTNVDGGSLVFAMILGVACGLAFGAAPAVQLARVDPQVTFRAGSRTAGRSAMRHALMGSQVLTRYLSERPRSACVSPLERPRSA